MAKPSRTTAVALLLSSLFSPSSSLALGVREDVMSNITTARAGARSALRSVLARVQADMVREGLKPRWDCTNSGPWCPFSGDSWNPWTGQFWNCVQTVLESTDPVWSVGESVAAVQSSCKEPDSKSCMSAKLGLSEDSLAAFAFLLDLPTSCFEKTCGGDMTATNTKDYRNPTVRYITLFSSFVDGVASLFGVTTGKLNFDLQCSRESPGDTLGDAFGVAWGSYWHPTFSSFIPVVKELREIKQATMADPDEIPWGKAEIAASAFEWIAGAVQTISEAEMDKAYPPNENDSKDKSADFGCAGAVSHIVASVAAFLGSIFKGAACWEGEWEAYQAPSVRVQSGAGAFGATTTTSTTSTTTTTRAPAALLDTIDATVDLPSVGPQFQGEVLSQPQPMPPITIPQPPQNSGGGPPPPNRPLPMLPWECLYPANLDTCLMYDQIFRLGRRNKDKRECYKECCLTGGYKGFDRVLNTRWCKAGRDQGGPPSPMERMKSLKDIEDKDVMVSRMTPLERATSMEKALAKEKKRQRQSKRFIFSGHDVP